MWPGQGCWGGEPQELASLSSWDEARACWACWTEAARPSGVRRWPLLTVLRTETLAVAAPLALFLAALRSPSLPLAPSLSHAPISPCFVEGSEKLGGVWPWPPTTLVELSSSLGFWELPGSCEARQL